jgi:urea carboxylase
VTDTVLVANRGEIAVRLVRAARMLGLRTVAVFSDADRGAPHVRLADEAVRLGPAAPSESYLRADAIVDAAIATGAELIHPGYGFLSEDADFAESVERAGLTFVGPTPHQLRVFGTKHTARAAAMTAGVPVFPGSELLGSAAEAVAAANAIGYPVMLKATAGGGGIGMQVCRDALELRAAFDRVTRLAERSFGSAGVFVERFVDHARHVEVQIFGDGAGRVVSLGDRDCSLQRRNQKVVEEAPAPQLPDALRAQLHSSSRALAESISYRSAGTVEFIYDPRRREASFLEVNARLQVEHPVTEAVTGIDLAAWMFRLARGERHLLDTYLPPGATAGEVPVLGHAVEARVYAEDPSRDYRPSTGTLTAVGFPDDDRVRIDTWVEVGTEVSASYDPLLAKVISAGAQRDEAFDLLGRALDATVIHGIEVNVGMLRVAVDRSDVRRATHSTSTLAGVADPRPRIAVERAGLLTTVQDLPGRAGMWDVGVPPSGPMDDLSFRLGNRALGNPDGVPGLECTASGPALRMTHPTTVCVTGAECLVTVDGSPVPMWEPIEVPGGSVLDVGAAETTGLRSYVLVEGGFDVPSYLGSASTFTLGRFGGHGGRQLVMCCARHQPAQARDPGPCRRNFARRCGRTGSCRSPRARTAHRSSSPAPISTHSGAPVTGCTSTRPARASGSKDPDPNGPDPTGETRDCTRRTSTTRLTPSGRSTSPVTRRSCSDPTDPAWAGSCARPRSSPPTAGSSGSCGRVTQCGSCRSVRPTPRHVTTSESPEAQPLPCGALAATGTTVCWLGGRMTARPRSRIGATATTTCWSSTVRWFSTLRCGHVYMRCTAVLPRLWPTAPSPGSST